MPKGVYKRTRKNPKDGQRFNRLSVIREVEMYVRPNSTGTRKFLCKCDCGNEKEVRLDKLRSGATKSCGCLLKEVSYKNGKKSVKHGMRDSIEYKIWGGMKARCNDINNLKYYGRGIKVCERWLKFENFYKDMGKRPIGMSIDRIDNNGDYEPTNCKWSTMTEQANNKRNNHFIKHEGETKTIAQWSRKLGLSRSTLTHRLARKGTIF